MCIRDRKGRDGARVPIPWTEDGPSFGFGTVEPWLPQPDHIGPLSAAAQERDAESMLSLYRSVIAARREHLVSDQSFELVDLGEDVLSYRRGDVHVVVNMGSISIPLPEGDVLVGSTPLVDGELAPDSAVWLVNP